MNGLVDFVRVWTCSWGHEETLKHLQKRSREIRSVLSKVTLVMVWRVVWRRTS